MHYTKPSLTNQTNAISAIQQQSLTDPSLKTADIFHDARTPVPDACTFNAYEADE